MRNYEYKVIETKSTGTPLGEGNTFKERLENGLNELGGNGWQLVTVVGSTLMIFTRPIERTWSSARWWGRRKA